MCSCRARRRNGETRAAVERLIEAGHCNAEIARILGISASTVCYHARALGRPADPRFLRRYDWAAVQRHYEAGHSVRDCLAHFGFSAKTFWDAVERGAVVTRPHAMPIDVLLSAPRSRTHLKGRLLAAGLKANRCELCGLTEWRGEPLSMALHHVNGDGLDNRLENLMLLCPNCHAQTPNFSGRAVRVRRLRLVEPAGDVDDAA